MLTNKYLVEETDHAAGGPHPFRGKQRIYRVGDYGLSVVNGPDLHAYPFAWEVAVIKFSGKQNGSFDLVYDTPLTSDVEVFSTDGGTEAFIQRAFKYFEKVLERKQKRNAATKEIK